MSTSIQTESGNFLDFLCPTPESINIHDIAHALSNTCRFGGHTVSFYSVAEHSYWCSLMVSPSHALDALLHDAQEAYVGDIPSPLKALLPDYRQIENKLETVVRKKFELPLQKSKETHLADKELCKIEARLLMQPSEWSKGEDHPRVNIRCYSPLEAYNVFMNRFNELLYV